MILFYFQSSTGDIEDVECTIPVRADTLMPLFVATSQDLISSEVQHILQTSDFEEDTSFIQTSNLGEVELASIESPQPIHLDTSLTSPPFDLARLVEEVFDMHVPLLTTDSEEEMDLLEAEHFETLQPVQLETLSFNTQSSLEGEMDALGHFPILQALQVDIPASEEEHVNLHLTQQEVEVMIDLLNL